MTNNILKGFSFYQVVLLLQLKIVCWNKLLILCELPRFEITISNLFLLQVRDTKSVILVTIYLNQPKYTWIYPKPTTFIESLGVYNLFPCSKTGTSSPWQQTLTSFIDWLLNLSDIPLSSLYIQHTNFYNFHIKFVYLVLLF